MPAKLDRCVKKLMDEGKTEEQAYAICNAAIKDQQGKMIVNFEDKTSISENKVISIRDGVMDYYGHEIGQEPANQLFKIYRSPEEVKRIAPLIPGLPITNGHVDPEGEIEEDLIHGKINGFEIVDAEENEHNSTIAVEHDVDLSENMLKYIQTKKPESSLGYTGKLIPHEEFDFEQVGLNPHHLAVVTNGRCGKICKFKDENMDPFLNEDGTLNLEAFLKAIGEVMEKADDTQKAEVLKALGMEPKPAEMDDQEGGAKKEDDEGDGNSSFKDESAIAANAIEKFLDSQKFQDAVGKAADERAQIITKATPFLDSKYDFAGKSNQKIMADTLAAEYKDQKFNDSELSPAFKMLNAKTVDDHKKFGDAEPNKWTKAKKVEM